MLYDEYKSKIIKLSKKLKKIRKIVIICFTATITVLAISAIIEFYRGSIISDISCEDIVYGESLEYNANAFLCDMSYEFKNEEGEWSNSIPRLAGSYFVRGKTENAFNICRYTSELTFTISPKELTLEPADFSWIFGNDMPYTDQNIICTGLNSGDIVDNLIFETSSEFPGNVIVSINEEKLRIISEGLDATSSYIISTNEKTATILRPQLSIITNNAVKEYDGIPLLQDTYEITAGAVSDNHTLQVNFLKSIIDVGNTQNEAKIIIFDTNGSDVSEYYDIETVFGKLSVTKREVTFTSASAEREYKGTPLTKEEYEISSGSLAEGEKAEVTFISPITNVGETENKFTVKITDKDGRDTTHNYDIKTVFGKLSVTKREVTFTSASAEREYDGTPLTKEEYEISSGSLAEGEKAEITFISSITNAGETENKFTVKITDKDGKDTTHNYDIKTVFGKLSVTKREVTFTSASAEREYDGTPLTKEEYEISSGSLAEGEKSKVTFISSITNVGETENRFTVKITDKDGRDTTHNYDISFDFGTLKVNKRQIKFTSVSVEKVYDGALANSEVCQISSGSLAEGHRYYETFSSTHLDVGIKFNVFTVQIMDATGKEVSDQYNILYEYGIINITPVLIVFSSDDLSVKYSGNPIENEKYTYRIIQGQLFSNDEAEVVFTNSYSNVGEYDIVFTVTIFRYENGQEEDITDNYKIFTSCGKLTVYPE